MMDLAILMFLCNGYFFCGVYCKIDLVTYYKLHYLPVIMSIPSDIGEFEHLQAL